ncbi:DUF6193 family natural product biosynthesis protein [Streptomyces sp. NBC_01465]|uniref:DUF6193 family natural product biosynthesis protein n=1 Tax=Streptomyces sp. NBC_01465 TaxID=2903878 RepID=UPI002E325FC3|nr:DUF6193 family natural product biosynthesis protein [Streptomyces sp. NBC_01465]
MVEIKGSVGGDGVEECLERGGGSSSAQARYQQCKLMGMQGASFAEAPDAKFYPELVEFGGLSRALRRVAEERSLDLGDVRPGSEQGLSVYRTVEADSSRGPIRVSTVLNRRAFSISIDSAAGDFVWAYGSATTLEDLADVIDAWRSGVLLAPLQERFPFIDFSKMAEGYERGTPVETAWNILLSEDTYDSRREMVAALHSRPRLSELFPFFSHEVLRLAVDPFDRDAGEICIELQVNGLYSMRSSDDEVLVGVGLADLADAATAIVEFLARRRPHG